MDRWTKWTGTLPRGNTKNPNEAITQGVPEKKVAIPFLPKKFGDVGQATIKGVNLTATFIGGRRFGLGLYINDIKTLLTVGSRPHPLVHLVHWSIHLVHSFGPFIGPFIWSIHLVHSPQTVKSRLHLFQGTSRDQYLMHV